MTRELFIGAAVLLILSPSALAQPAGAGPAPGAATGITPPTAGTTAPGVAGGVQPYRPAGVGGAAGAAAGGVAGPVDTSVGGQINSTLQAGQIPASGLIPGSDSATVGGASTGQGMRRPNPSTGAYGGLSNPAYVPPGATPYTRPAGAAGSAASPTTGSAPAP